MKYVSSAGQPQEAPDTTTTWDASDGTIQDGLPGPGAFTNAAGQPMDGADRTDPYRDSAGNFLGAAVLTP